MLNNVALTNSVEWFPDTSANQHITPDLANLIGFEPYLDNNHLHVSDGKGLSTSNIRHTKLYTPKCTFTFPMFFMYHIFKSHCFLFKKLS